MKNQFSTLRRTLIQVKVKNQLCAAFWARGASLVVLALLALAPAAWAGTEITYATPGNYGWTCPPGVNQVQVECYGGGGAGGGTLHQTACAGGGGSGGAYVIATVSVTPGNTYLFTVGAGGAGVAAANGNPGGSSYFANTSAGSSSGASIIAPGGNPGTYVASGSGGIGQAGAAPSGATVPSGGSATYALAGSPAANNASGGAGSAGAGPLGGSAGGTKTSEGNGVTASAPGGGGGGALSTAAGSATDRSGGAGGAGQVTLTYSAVTTTIYSTGGSYAWIAPITGNVTVECWGAGGAGGSAQKAGGNAYGGGGAGGAYAKLNSFSVTVGTTYYVNVGAGGVSALASSGTPTVTVSGGDSWFNTANSPSSTIIAKGGAGGQSVYVTSSTTYGTGGTGTATGSVGDVVNAGGSGATGNNATYAGAGGASGGTGTTTGGNPGTSATANSGTGAVPVAGGGNGGNPNPTSGNSGAGQSPTIPPGGGGGGASERSTGTLTGGTGADGQVMITYASKAYRSGQASVTWETANNWQVSTDGGATWSPASTTPGAADNVYIQSGHTVTLGNNESCADLHIANSTTSSLGTSGTIALGANTLSVYGKLRQYYAAVGTTPGTNSTAGFSTYPFTASSGKVSIAGNSRTLTYPGEWGVTITTPATGTLNVSVDLNVGQTVTVNNSMRATSWTFNSGKFSLVGGVGNSRICPDNGTVGQGDITINSGAVVMSTGSGKTSGNQVISQGGTSRGGTLTIASGGKLQLSGGTPTIDMNTVTINGAVEYINSGAQTLVQPSGVASSAAAITTYQDLILNGDGAKALYANTTVNGVLTMAGDTTGVSLALSTFTLTYGGSSTLAYAGAAAQTTTTVEFPASSGPNSLTISNASGVTLDATTKTINGTVTMATGALTLGSGTLAYGASGTLAYAGSSAQTTAAAEFPSSSGPNNLTVNNASGVTLGVSRTINGTVTLTAGQLKKGSYALTLGNSAAMVVNNTGTAGSLDAAPTFGTAVNVSYTGTSATTTSNEIPTSSSVLNNLIINDAAGVTLGGNATANGTLTFTSGKITTGANTLTLGSSATISGAGTGKYVYGTLAKTYGSTGSQTFTTFPIGDSGNYTPVSLPNLNVSTLGATPTITASTVANHNSDGQYGSSGLSASQYVERTWTLTVGGTLAATHDITLNFVAGDLVGSPTTSILGIGQYSGASWTLPTISSALSTSTTATGLTGFGDFVIGQTATVTLPVVASPTKAAIASTTATLGATVTANGGGTISEYGLVLALGSVTTSPTTANTKISDGNTLTIGSAYTVSASSLTAGIQYYYAGYAINSAGTAYSSYDSFYTLSTVPSTSAGSFTATAASSTSINLSWTAATGAGGYLILQKSGASAPTGTPSNATGYSVGNTISDGTVAAIVTPGSATSTIISGLSANSQYSFTIIPFAWDGANATTYNYKTTSIPSGTVTTQYTPKYRSLTSGNWGDYTTWQISTDNGSTWAAATSGQFPTGTESTVEIVNGTTVTMNVPATGNNLTVDGTGILVASATLTLTGTTAINGTYKHNIAGGTVPTANWASTSACEIDGATTAAPAGLNQNFGNFTWNCSSQSADITSPAINTPIAGKLYVQNTGGKALCLDKSMTINGDLQVDSGANLVNSSTASPWTLTVGGNVAVAGTLNGTLTGVSASQKLVLTGSGNLNIAGWDAYSGTTTHLLLVTNLPGVVTTVTGNLAPTGTQTLSAGGTLVMGTYIYSGSTAKLTIGSTGVLKLGSLDAGGALSTTASTGNIQAGGTRTYGSGCAIVYNGSGAQVAGNGLVSTANLEIANANGVSLNVATSVGNLTLTSGALSIGANTLTLNGTVTATSGTLTGGTSSSINCSGSSAITLPAISGGLGSLTVNDAAGATIAANTAIQGALYIQSGTLTPTGTGSTAGGLTFNNSTYQANGTYGNTGSGAGTSDSTHFAGSGYVTVAANLTVSSGTLFRSKASGNWNSVGTWEASNDSGTTWLSFPSTYPGSAHTVYIQSQHVVTLAENEDCNNLNICTASGSTPSSTTLGQIALGNYTLSLHGTLAEFTGAAGVWPVTANNGGWSIYPFTSTGGRLSIVGTTRTLMPASSWSPTVTTGSTGFPLSVDLQDNSQTVTLNNGLAVSSCTVNTGIFDITSQNFRLNSGTLGVGDLTIASGARLRTSSGASAISGGGAGKRGGTLTVNGTLELSAQTPTMEMAAYVFNGTVDYTHAGAATLLAKGTDASGADPNAVTYNNVILEGSNTRTLAASITVNGTLTLGGTASLALSTFTLTYSGSSTLQYAGTAQQTTAATEFPASGSLPTNLKISNTANSVKLGGSRTISGTLTVDAGANLDFNSQTLTAGGTSLNGTGTLTMEVTKSGANTFTGSQLILSSGTLTYGGSLTVSKSGSALALGDSIPLFVSSGGFGGSFTGATLPSVATGLMWNSGGSPIQPVSGAYAVTCNGTLTASAAATTSICSGGSYSLNGSATGGSGSGTYTYGWSSSPSGFTSTLANPSVSPTTMTTYTLTVTDANGCTASTTTTVTVNAAPTITTVSLPNADTINAYSQSVSATAGTGGTTTFTVASGLPPGLSISGAGVITGTATTPGVYPFNVTATDSASTHCASTANLSITVNPTVSFNGNGGSTVSSQTVTYNGTATQSVDPTKTGYTFAGWYSDSGLTSAFSFSTAITANTTLYAKWNVAAVTFNLLSSSQTNGYHDGVFFTATNLPSAAGSNVVFSANGVPFSTNNVLNGGTTSLSITNLPRGTTNEIVAFYNGDGTYPAGSTNLIQTITNHAPVVAAEMNVLRTPGEAVLIALSEMATNWSDADGDWVQMTAFNGVTTNGMNLTALNLTTDGGGYVTTNIAYLGYTNNANLNDRFSYSVGDGFGGTNIGYVNVVVSPFVSGQVISGQQTTNAISGSSFTVTYYGIPGYTYLLERSTNLTDWVDIATNTIGGGGVTNVLDNFGDLDFVHPSSAYYRVGWKVAY